MITPPLNKESASALLRTLEAIWNSRDTRACARFLDEGSILREGDKVFAGVDQVLEQLQAGWNDRLHQRYSFQINSFDSNVIFAHFSSEWQSPRYGQWYRAQGTAHFFMNEKGLLTLIEMSAEVAPILTSERNIRVHSTKVLSN